jgi:aryl-alcohol dehydrogenase-like predicted oxidoreductase
MDMQYTTLGRTGLRVSVAGLGCGGFSKLGLGKGKSETDAVTLIRRALDLGVNLLDTASVYGTEAAVGKGIKGYSRDKVVISTKAKPNNASKLIPVADVIGSLDKSLRQLDVDYVDILHLHGVLPQHYDVIYNGYVPALLKERDKGKFRFIGITESPYHDPIQEMVSRALQDDVWDVLMIGFHMLNQMPRKRILPTIIKKNVGTLIMYIVRNIFSVPGRLLEEILGQIAAGKLPAAMADDRDPLNFLLHKAGAESLIDAAYRYVRHEPGCNVVLFGTSDAKHMEANIASILRPPLPEADRLRLAKVFGHLEGVGFDLPGPI